LVVES